MAARACTIVSVSHLAQARVLAGSFLGSHPGGEVVVLLTDDPHGELVDDSSEPFRVMRPDRLDLEPGEFVVMAGLYGAMELAVSLKPWLMRRLLEESGEPLLYLDSDIEVFAPLDDLLELSAQHGIAVTPHLSTPLPRDGLRPSSADILWAGIYNAGFVGAGPHALSSGFFEFWCEQLARDSIHDQANMLHGDQAWLDFVDCFDHTVVRDATVNLAYWNAWAHALTLDDGRVLVDGRPLRFFHFSGFDPQRPDLLSVHQNRIELEDEPVLSRLCRSYAAAVIDAGSDGCGLVPYGWARSGDLALDQPARRAYREAVLAADETGVGRPPSPFASDRGDDFLAWLNESPTPDGCTRYLRAYRDGRPDLHHAYPDPDGVDAPRLLRDAALSEGLRASLAAQCVPRLGHPDGAENHPLPGIDVAGDFAESSTGAEAGRLVVRAAAAAGLPIATRSPAGAEPATLAAEGDATWPFDVSVMCIEPDAQVGPEAFRNRRTVGLWNGELPSSAPEAWDGVDELWVTSTFVQEALKPAAPQPVRVFPWPVETPNEPPRLTREDLGLPSGFLVLGLLELRHGAERENPAGLVEAYRRAFSPADGAHLVLQVTGADPDRASLERLRGGIDRPDVTLRERALCRVELRALIAHADCYASLHRCEGFGLRLAEAMALGKPTVATAWSANLEFTDDQTGLLVPAEPTPVTASSAAGGRWAEPDTAVAAAHLRWVFDNPADAAAMGARARDRIASTRTVEAAGRFVADAAEQLRNGASRG